MKKTCSVNKKCLSLFRRFSLRTLPARCKFTVLIFKMAAGLFDTHRQLPVNDVTEDFGEEADVLKRGMGNGE